MKDMNGSILTKGDVVRKYSIIGNKESSFEEGIISKIGPMNSSGEDMVWTQSGGAHHPMACIKISGEDAKELKIKILRDEFNSKSIGERKEIGKFRDLERIVQLKREKRALIKMSNKRIREINEVIEDINSKLGRDL